MTYCLHVFWSCVSVVNVVGVLPNVNSQKRLETLTNWVLSVRCVDNKELVIFFSEPSPSWTEVTNSLCCEFFQKLLNALPFLFYQFFQLSFRTRLIRRNAVPKKGVIPMLQSIIQNLDILASTYPLHYPVIICSNAFPSHSVPLINLFKLST